MWSKLIQQKLLRRATNSDESFWNAAVEWAGWELPDVIGVNAVFHFYGPIRKIEKEGDSRNLFEIADQVITMSEETLGWLENKLDVLKTVKAEEEEIWSKPLHIFAEYSDDEFIPYTGKCAEEWNLQHVAFDSNDVLAGVLVVDDELFKLCEVSENPEEQLYVLHHFLLDHPLSYALRKAEGNDKTKIVSQLMPSPEKKRLITEFFADDALAWSFLCFLAYFAKIIKQKEHDRLESVIYDFNREVKEKKLCQEIDKLDIQIFLSLLEEDIWLTDSYLIQDKNWNAPVPRWHSFLVTVADMIFVKSQRVLNRKVLAGEIQITREFCWVIPKERAKALVKSLQKNGSREAKKRLVSILNCEKELFTVKERDSICRSIFAEGLLPVFITIANSPPGSYVSWYAAEYHGFMDARTHLATDE